MWNNEGNILFHLNDKQNYVPRNEMCSGETHICGHCIMGQISFWPAPLSLRSTCRAPGPTITPDHYQAHMKAIKSNLNQIPIGFTPLLCVCVCLCMSNGWANIAHTQRKHCNVILGAVHKCVCECNWRRNGKKMRKPAQWVSKQNKSTLYFLLSIQHIINKNTLQYSYKDN